MVDAAVWCDYFARLNVSTLSVARATAYLFKVPEGGAKGVDPGFHRQMQELESTLKQVSSGDSPENAADLRTLFKRVLLPESSWKNKPQRFNRWLVLASM
jgi:hypothetical protein